MFSRYTHSPKGSCVYEGNTSGKSDIPKYTTRLNFVENKTAAHDGKVGLNTVEYTTAFLYSDWLHFLWHGIKPKNLFPAIASYQLPGRDMPLQNLRGETLNYRSGAVPKELLKTVF